MFYEGELKKVKINVVYYCMQSYITAHVGPMKTQLLTGPKMQKVIINWDPWPVFNGKNYSIQIKLGP